MYLLLRSNFAIPRSSNILQCVNTKCVRLCICVGIKLRWHRFYFLRRCLSASTIFLNSYLWTSILYVSVHFTCNAQTDTQLNGTILDRKHFTMNHRKICCYCYYQRYIAIADGNGTNIHILK